MSIFKLNWAKVLMPLHWITVLSVLVFDQITKIWVIYNIEAYREEIPIWLPWFKFVHIKNPGAAWGLLGDSSPWLRLAVFGTVTVFCVIFILHELSNSKKSQVFYRMGLAMILGGALGNLVDRVLFQEVTDFIAVFIPVIDYHYPRFNIADSGITVGVGLIILQFFWHPKKRSA